MGNGMDPQSQSNHQALRYSLETATCEICGSSLYNPYITQAKELYNNLDAYFNIVRCTNCTHVFTNPRPTLESIGVFYPDTAGYYVYDSLKPLKGTFGDKINWSILTENFSFPKRDTVSPVHRLLGKMLYRLRARGIRCRHIPQYKSGGKVLDLGCANGNYLMFLKNLGFHDLYGIEINEQCVRQAHELGLTQVQQGKLTELNYQENFFDYIHMSMVLEHSHHPKALLENVFKLLKPNGQLILSVPNIHGFEAKVFGRYFYGLQVPEHLHHFHSKTITTILKNTGFQIEHIDFQAVDRDIIASAELAGQKWIAKILRQRWIRKIILRPFIELLASLSLTSRMSVTARRGPATR